MSEDKGDVGGTPPVDGDEQEQLKGIDQAMLSALMNSRRDSTALTSDQEQLIDDWMADRLPSGKAARAADLSRNNVFAAERILEHRLLSAANQGPPVPEPLTERILKAANTPPAWTLGQQWITDRRPPSDAVRPVGRARNSAVTTEASQTLFSPRPDRAEPSAPPSVVEQIHSATNRPAARTFGLRWPVFSTWQWSGSAGAIAVAALVAVVGVQQWRGSIEPDASWSPGSTRQFESSLATVNQETMQYSKHSDPPIQVAMATIGDRSVLFEASDVRMRGTQQSPTVEKRFRDVEVPTELLRRLIAGVASGIGDAATREILPFLGNTLRLLGTPIHIVIDAALAAKVTDRSWRENTTVRIYDLDDPRVADVRGKIEPPLPSSSSYFLTLKP